MKTIDLTRLERRFIVPKEEAASLLKCLNKASKSLSHDKEIVQTIYLNDDNLSASWKMSLKARRYLKRPDIEAIDINPSELFKCELKKERAGNPVKTKTKVYSTLPNFCFWATTRLSDVLGSTSLRPHVLSQYRRRHFLPLPTNNNLEMRVTADTEMAYGFFPKDRPFVWTGKENGLRVEIKTNPELTDSAAYKEIVILLQQHGAIPVISKKGQAYNLHAKYLNQQFGSKIQKELLDTEAEAKFLINHPQPTALFFEIRKALQNREIPGFSLDSYPHTHSSDSINFYWDTGREKTNGLKLLYKGLFFRAVTKAKTRILKDAYGLNCLMVRQEKKGERTEYSRENLDRVLTEHAEKFGPIKPLGHLSRARLSIWADNINNGRIFHLTIDRCTKEGGKVLYQLEIEYAGRKAVYPQSEITPEKDIMKNLCDLSWSIYQFANKKAAPSHPFLTPNQLTKLEWLNS